MCGIVAIGEFTDLKRNDIRKIEVYFVPGEFVIARSERWIV